jgi:quercetin dioxygenase-like cupin family protein
MRLARLYSGGTERGGIGPSLQCKYRPAAQGAPAGPDHLLRWTDEDRQATSTTKPAILARGLACYPCHRPFDTLRSTHAQHEEEPVIQVLDLKAEFASLTMLRNRTPTSSEAERKGAFARIAPYRDGALFTAKFAGTSAWERHPQGDEIVQIVDGATTLHLMTAEGRQSVALRAGMLAIVPQNTWHQFEAPDGVSVMTATPQPTEHVRVDVEDPRTTD